MPDTLIDDPEVRRRAGSVALAMVGNAADAEDVVQDALLVAFDKARSIPPQDRASWFIGVVRNVARNHIRRRALRTMSECTEDTALTQREHLDPADAQSLIAAPQEVSDDERESIVLCHMQGYSLDEVSAILGVNRNTLKSRIQRGMACLREKLRVSRPGLEAYQAAVAMPPPEGGFDAALARWKQGVDPGGFWAWPWVKVAGLADVVTPGAYRVRIKLYANGTVEAQWNELQRGPRLYTLDGIFAGFYPGGVLRETGQFANNLRTGPWRSFHGNGALESIGEYQQGLQEGLWETYNEAGILREKGHFKNDLRSGEWELFFGDTGTIRERVEFCRGKRHGPGLRFDRRGNLVSETQWDTGQKHGLERLYGPQGIEEHRYERGQRLP